MAQISIGLLNNLKQYLFIYSYMMEKKIKFRNKFKFLTVRISSNAPIPKWRGNAFNNNAAILKIQKRWHNIATHINTIAFTLHFYCLLFWIRKWLCHFFVIHVFLSVSVHKSQSVVQQKWSSAHIHFKIKLIVPLFPLFWICSTHIFLLLNIHLSIIMCGSVYE